MQRKAARAQCPHKEVRGVPQGPLRRGSIGGAGSSFVGRRGGPASREQPSTVNRRPPRRTAVGRSDAGCRPAATAQRPARSRQTVVIIPAPSSLYLRPATGTLPVRRSAMGGARRPFRAARNCPTSRIALQRTRPSSPRIDHDSKIKPILPAGRLGGETASLRSTQ